MQILSKLNTLNSKQIGFQKEHFEKHTIAQSIDQIYKSFENSDNPLSVFRAFDTVEHKILLGNFRYSEFRKEILTYSEAI